MRYNEAAFIGQQRAKDAQMRLFNFTGFAMLTYTIKQNNKDGGFNPVGKETFVAKATYENQTIIYFTDEEGFAKAQSKPLESDKAFKIFEDIKNDGILEFDGEIKTI